MYKVYLHMRVDIQHQCFVEDGKAYLSSHDGTEAYVYIVDPETATATKGAKNTRISTQRNF